MLCTEVSGNFSQGSHLKIKRRRRKASRCYLDEFLFLWFNISPVVKNKVWFFEQSFLAEITIKDLFKDESDDKDSYLFAE